MSTLADVKHLAEGSACKLEDGRARKRKHEGTGARDTPEEVWSAMVRVFLDGPPELAITDVAKRFGVLYSAAMTRAHRDLWWEHKRVESARRNGNAVELLEATRWLAWHLERREEAEQWRAEYSTCAANRSATRRRKVIQLFPKRHKIDPGMRGE